MIDCRFKPIEKWPSKPTPEYMRLHSRFKAGWQATLELLERELNHLGAEDINVEGFFFAHEIRNDGWPKSNARPTQPGVILSFTTWQGRMVMPCDRYHHWEANLRAIERYGATTEKQEQYTGWLRLPAAGASDEAVECAKILIQHLSVGYTTSQILGDQQIFKQVYAEAMRRTHPDTSPGRDVAEFQNVVNARDRIKTLKGWS